jgi:signal peptidase I
MRFIIGLGGSLLAPGFGQALAGRTKRAVLWLVAIAVALLAVALSVWALPALVVVRIASVIDAGIVLRAERSRPQAHWAAAVIVFVLSFPLGFIVRACMLEAFSIPSSSQYPTLHIGDHLLVDKLALRTRGIAHGDVIVFAQPCNPERAYVERVIATAGETVEIRCDTVYVNGQPIANQLVAADRSYEDDVDGHRSVRQSSEYLETHGGHRYHVFHDPGRPERDHAGAMDPDKDFPRLDGAHEPPSCAQQQDSFGTPPPAQQLPGKLVETRPRATDCRPQLHFVVPENHLFGLGDNRPNSNDSRYWGAIPIANVRGLVITIWWPAHGEWSRLGGVE